MGRSIGTLYIDIIARTEQLERDMARAKSQVSGLAGETTKAGTAAKAAFQNFQLWNSFQGRGMTGITLDMMAFMLVTKAVTNELKYIYLNAEQIRGIDPVALTSIQEMRVNIMGAREELDKLIAKWIISPFVLGAQAVGIAMANAMGMNATPDNKLLSLDDIEKARIGVVAFNQQIDQTRTKLADMRRETKLSEMMPAAKANELQRQAEIIRLTINDAHTTIDNMKNEVKMQQLLTDAGKIRLELEKRVVTFQRQASVELTQERLAEMSQLGRIAELKRMILTSSIGTGLAAGGLTGFQSFNLMTVEQLQAMHDKFPELLKYWQELRREIASIKTPALEFRDAFVSGFQEMSTVATNFATGLDSDFNKTLKSLTDKIVNTFFQLALINPLLMGMFGNTKGFSVLPTLWSLPGLAAGGPGSGWSMVGENGPEMVKLPSGSTVLPNDQTNRMFGGRGNVYQIDARGADPSVVARLSQALMALAGPGVVEQRAMSAQRDAEWRRY